MSNKIDDMITELKSLLSDSKYKILKVDKDEIDKIIKHSEENPVIVSQEFNDYVEKYNSFDVEIPDPDEYVGHLNEVLQQVIDEEKKKGDIIDSELMYQLAPFSIIYVTIKFRFGILKYLSAISVLSNNDKEIPVPIDLFKLLMDLFHITDNDSDDKKDLLILPMSNGISVQTPNKSDHDKFNIIRILIDMIRYDDTCMFCKENRTCSKSNCKDNKTIN